MIIFLFNNKVKILVNFPCQPFPEVGLRKGFPDTFKIQVSNTQAYRQFGNSVPVKVVEKVAEQMIKHLNLGIKPEKVYYRNDSKKINRKHVSENLTTNI